MGASLLTLIQRAQRELGLPVSPTVVGSTEMQAQQFFGVANAIGDELLAMHEWTALQAQAIINVEVPITTTADVLNNSGVLSNIPADLSAVTPYHYVVSGNGIQTASRVTEITIVEPGDDSLTMDMHATETGADVAIQIARDTYDVPEDFQSFINQTQWDRTNHWALIGPMSPQENQWVMSGIVATGPRRRYRQVGRLNDVFRIWPPPTTSDTDTPATLAYEYLSRYWATSNSGTAQAQFVLDTDTCVFDDRVMVAGIKYLFFSTKGFDASRLERDYVNLRQTAMGRDGGAPVLNLARRTFPILVSPANVQDGSFPGPGNP